jgi:hypothetical protein
MRIVQPKMGLVNSSSKLTKTKHDEIKVRHHSVNRDISYYILAPQNGNPFPTGLINT